MYSMVILDDEKIVLQGIQKLLILLILIYHILRQFPDHIHNPWLQNRRQ